MIRTNCQKSSYTIRRTSCFHHQYRLKRRYQQVASAIKKFGPNNRLRILDIGCHEGIMLTWFKEEFPNIDCVGIDTDSVALSANKNDQIKLIEADATSLPFSDQYFDVIYTTAVINYLANPRKMFTQIYRTLVPQGIGIITAPDPLWYKLYRKARIIKERSLFQTISLETLKEYSIENNFTVLYQGKYMLSPIGLFFGRALPRKDY